MSESVTDADLWGRAAHGDGEAFGQVFDAHEARIYRRALSLLGSREDAKDAVAITFLEAWRRRGTVRLVDSSLLPWLLVTCANASRNIARSRRRYQHLLDRVPTKLTYSDPEFTFELSRVEQELTKMSINHRNVIVLCVLEGFSEVEAAHALGIAVGTVKSRLFRAKRQLARALVPTEVPDVAILKGSKND